MEINRILAFIGAVAITMKEANPDGQKVIRRAVGFEKFLRGEMTKTDALVDR